MNLLPELTGRRALRALSEQALEDSALRRLFEAAVLAPSCNNKQPWRFVAVRQQPLLDELRGLFTEGNYWAKKAPVVVAAWTHVDFDARNPDGRDFAEFDLGQAVMALQAQAQREDLVAHPFAGFDMPRAAALLGLPEGAKILVLIAVAHRGSEDHLSEKHRVTEHSERTRRPVDEVVSFR